MRNPNAKPRSAQRQAVLALFETMDVITKYHAADAIGLSHVSAANLLSAMAQDGVIARGADIPAVTGSPARTFVRARKAGGFNPFLIMQLRRRTNEQLGITP
jgi:predicted ArsR family transcriptional regulator